jgi:hypothetical protein
MRFHKWIFLFIFVGVSLWGQQNVGDTLGVMVNYFSTPPTRVSELAIVRDVGDYFIYTSQVPDTASFYVFTSLTVIGPPDSIKALAGTIGEYVFWYNEPHKPPIWNQRVAGVTENVYDVFAEMASNRRGTFYLAGEDGVVWARKTPYAGASWSLKPVVVNGDTIKPVYALATNPLTEGDNLILLVGTVEGVYRSVAANPPWEVLGLTQDTIISLEVDPVDTGVVYAGAKSGLYVKFGTQDFQDVTPSSLSNPEITAIEAVPLGGDTSIVFAATHEGLYFAKVYNRSLVTEFTLADGTSGYDISDVKAYDPDEVLISVPGTGIFRTVSGSNWGGTVSWEPLNEGLEVFDPFFHSLTVYALSIYGSGHYFAATSYGVYEYKSETGKWTGWREGMPGVVTDALIENVKQAFEAFYPVILDTFQVTQEELYDVDGISKIYVHITPLFIGGVAQGTYGNIYGYFDSVDETDSTSGSFRDIIVINQTDYADPSDTLARPWALAYFFGRYVAWSLDQDDEAYIYAGFGMLAAEKAGLNPPYRVLSQEVPPIPTITGPNVWSTSSVLETFRDRSRIYMWYKYLEETFGFDFILSVLRDTLNGYSSWASLLEGEGTSLSDVVKDWHIWSFKNNLVNTQILVSPSDPPEVFGLDRLSSFYWKITPVDTLLRLNGEDGKLLYAVFLEDDSIVNDLSSQIDSTARLIFDNSEGKSGTFIVVNGETGDANTHTLSRDFVAPSGDLFTLQNSIYDFYFTLYVVSNDAIVSDISAINPDYLLLAGDSIIERGTFEAWFTHDTLYGYKALSRANAEGDIVYYLWAQDISGNELIATDSFSIHIIEPSGGMEVALNGEVILEVPEGAVNITCYVVIDKTEEKSFVAASIIREDTKNEGLSPIYSIGTDELVFSKPVDLKVRFKDPDAGLYLYQNERWVEVPTRSENGYVVGTITRGGLYQVRRGPGSFETSTTWLGLAYPNPVISRNGSVIIPFSLSNDGIVKLSVYDISGRKIITLLNGKADAGNNEVEWNLRNERGRMVNAGVYFYRLKTKDYSAVRKLVILK